MVPPVAHVRLIATIALALSALSCSDDRQSARRDIPWADSVPHLVGGIDLVITDDPNAGEHYMFGRIAGLELDSAGRIFVSDQIANEVRAFGPDGDYLYTVAGPGNGPGELPGRADEIVLAPDGRLWVLVSVGTYSFEIFTLGPTSAEYLHTVRFWETPLWGSPMFDGSDAMHVAASLTREEYETGMEARGQHVLFDSTGRRLGRVLLPPNAPRDSFTPWPQVVVPRPGRRDAHPAFPMPFRNNDVLAQAPDGRFARVLTSHYRIELFDKNAEATGEIRRDLAGPPVSQFERDSVQRWMDSIETVVIQQWRGTFTPAPIPVTKPPIWWIWYDRDGRLWVQHYYEHRDSLAWADVYGRDGELLFTAEWPRRARLILGAMRGNVALGVTRDELDVERVVRVRFRR